MREKEKMTASSTRDEQLPQKLLHRKNKNKHKNKTSRKQQSVLQVNQTIPFRELSSGVSQPSGTADGPLPSAGRSPPGRRVRPHVRARAGTTSPAPAPECGTRAPSPARRRLPAPAPGARSQRPLPGSPRRKVKPQLLAAASRGTKPPRDKGGSAVPAKAPEAGMGARQARPRGPPGTPGDGGGAASRPGHSSAAHGHELHLHMPQCGHSSRGPRSPSGRRPPQPTWPTRASRVAAPCLSFPPPLGSWSPTASGLPVRTRPGTTATHRPALAGSGAGAPGPPGPAPDRGARPGGPPPRPRPRPGSPPPTPSSPGTLGCSPRSAVRPARTQTSARAGSGGRWFRLAGSRPPPPPPPRSRADRPAPTPAPAPASRAPRAEQAHAARGALPVRGTRRPDPAAPRGSFSAPAGATEAAAATAPAPPAPPRAPPALESPGSRPAGERRGEGL
ncbi:basic salivary proline-rich protein 2-like [Dipodomys merriami]|uniref:basic salivary proline-rich protein 2-like n=1 Tax=Dipodomys merriami TaxID=94247 RepID=UPI0038560AF1